MEVHADHGDVQSILDALAAHGFSVVIGDVVFRHVSDPQQAPFIWAWKQNDNRASRREASPMRAHS
jgi:hypothetical protein